MGHYAHVVNDSNKIMQDAHTVFCTFPLLMCDFAPVCEG